MKEKYSAGSSKIVKSEPKKDGNGSSIETIEEGVNGLIEELSEMQKLVTWNWWSRINSGKSQGKRRKLANSIESSSIPQSIFNYDILLIFGTTLKPLWEAS